jgi:TIR domain
VTDGFVSYSRRDRETVLPVVRAAEALDRSLWFDGDDIPAAPVWRDELADAIAASDTFVCFLSSHWLRSDECRREYERARELANASCRSSSPTPPTPRPSWPPCSGSTPATGRARSRWPNRWKRVLLPATSGGGAGGGRRSVIALSGRWRRR